MLSKNKLFLFISLSFIATLSNNNNILLGIKKNYNTRQKLQRQLAYRPTGFNILFQLGNEFYKEKQYSEAIIYYKKSLQKNPTHIHALYNLGLAHLAYKNKTEEAKEAFIKITHIQPKNYYAYYQIGSICEKDKQLQQAIAYYEKTIEINPSCLPALVKLGILYKDLKNPETSFFYLEKALSLDPNNISLIFSAGSTLNDLGRCKKAADLYLKAAEIDPQNYTAIYNAGYSLKVYGNIDQAINLYNMALEINPDYDNATYAIALAYLYKGDFEKGWKYYENRLIKEKRNAPIIRNGIKTGNLKGKIIYLIPEGGFGDTIQFIRYIQELKEMGAQVFVSVQPQLYKLISNSPLIEHLLPPGKKPTVFDDYATIMSLPALFISTEETIPKNIPYIFPDKTLEKKWQEYFTNKDNQYSFETKGKPFRIGLCWQSDLKNDRSRVLCAHRSIPLKKLEKLSHIPNIEFYSLQKTINPDHFQDLSKDFVINTFGPDFDTSGAFMDTAAIMKQLDLIISVDTSIPHLAGAVGAPVWVILPYNTDWRWIANREDSPWYPTMKIFKQPKAFDWDSVVDKVFHALLKKVNSQHDNIRI